MKRFLSILVPVFCILSGSAYASCSNCTPPRSMQQWWSPGTTIGVYIDPSFVQQTGFSEITVIQNAVGEWFGQSGLTDNGVGYTLLNSDPGASAQDVVRILNQPMLGQNAIAHMAPTIYTATGQMYDATIYFDRNFMLDSTTYAYDPTGTNAQTFFKKIFHHELGHFFGEDDIDTPINPSTSSPDPCLQSAGASVMNGYCNQNDSGGISPASITDCDSFVVNVTISVGGTVRSALAGEYILREGCGVDVYDSGPVGLNGTLAGGSWTSLGLSMSDSHTADGVILPDALLATDHTSVIGFTIEFWVNLDPESYSDYFASFSNSGISLLQYRWNGNSQVGVWINGADTSTGIVNMGSSYWPPSTWQHVAIVRSTNGNTVKIYLNGVLDSTATVQNNVAVGLDTTAAGQTVSAGPKVIGATTVNYDNPSITGTMGEMRIYSAALFDADILANYNARKSVYGIP